MSEKELKEKYMKKGFVIGLIVGAFCMGFLWFFATDWVEQSKVNSGYLTYKNAVYSVTLYDTLDTPEEKDND